MLLHVAPLVGAWIEIIFINKNFFTIGSLLSWERGLKLSSAIVNFLMVCRSSRGSVDWNIKWKDILQGKLSRSSRGSVDWNPKTSPRWLQRMVAPLVGAWIEINVSSNIIKPLESLLSWERGLKSSYIRNINIRNCRSSRGSVDWNSAGVSFGSSKYCRSSRGSVDWNYWSTTINFIYISVAPLVGAWIEIRAESERDIAVAVAPLVGAWIEI